MAKFTRDDVMQVIEDGRKCVGADLRNIDLSDAGLWAANLSGANLTGVDLRGANLSYANLRWAKYSANTQWPAGFDPVAAGAVLVDG